MEQQNYKVGAYCRLSRDDENIGESGSITNQKDFIKQYCKNNNLEISITYQDDGWSGTNFERPDFQRMLEDIESGKINMVITKDLSRFGRDYIMTGYYLEIYFPNNSVRYVAINDNFDSNNANSSSNDFAAMRNVFNDMVAKDTSKKVRSVKHSKMINGEHEATYAAYGYKKNPDVKNNIIPDEETAPVIQQIFKMYLDGKGSFQIRNYLEENKILTPSALLHMRGERCFEAMHYDSDESARYKWNYDMVLRILNNEVYIGNSVHYRNRKANHKSKNKRQAKENWLIIPNTHEPLIDKAVWDEVQKRLQMHPDSTKIHENIFLGIVKCADCGKSMSFSSKNYDGKEVQRQIRSLTCHTYTKYGKSGCSCHHTDYDNIVNLTLAVVNNIIKQAQLDEGSIVAKLRKQKSSKRDSATEKSVKKISTLEKRLAEIIKIYTKLYEDRALGAITEGNYRLLSDKFETEQKSVTTELELLKNKAAEVIQTEDNIQNFVELIREMQELKTLDRQIVTKLIDKIEIGNVIKTENGKFQQIDIFYRFIGKFSL